ncbi:toxin-antitoxin system, toxin component domain protein [Tolypothrix sp. PCC 7601]|nr:toxin-antitoxin system, toxin component domain protein [Tolypothrix sp. PCC 7601]
MNVQSVEYSQQVTALTSKLLRLMVTQYCSVKDFQLLIWFGEKLKG